jgi:predicted KAP-like P-loop ATPase
MGSLEAYRISPDRPLENPRDDRLGYRPFAEYLAETIQRMDSTQGAVVALYGVWGSGKSTLLNFIEHEIGRKQPQEDRPIIVRFNPWWFSGHEDLAARFFDQLLLTLDEKGYGERELRQHIADLAKSVAGTNLPYAWIPTLIGYLVEPKRQSVNELKEDIDELLQTQHRLLVIIDDIDRLLAEEVRQLFRVIKAVANFPNTTYLLAFDRKVVAKALADTQDGTGESYLEKIVQAPFELPPADESSLQALFFERLDIVFQGTPEFLIDQDHWTNLYFEGVAHFINTPRDIMRFTNTLYVTYPGVKGEVNFPDFVGIEALRVFSPQVYSVIRSNESAFTGHAQGRGLFGRSTEELKPFHDAWLDDVEEDDRPAVRHLTEALFPKLEGVWGRTQYGADWESTWRSKLRVCSPDIFPTYFRLAVPESGISNSEMQYILSLTGDTGAFSKVLLELADQVRPDGTSRLRVVLDRLVDYAAEEIPEDNIAPVVHAFFTDLSKDC